MVCETLDMSTSTWMTAGNTTERIAAPSSHSKLTQSNSPVESVKALADYAHARGFKLGLYGSPSPQTCSGFTASGGHEVEDAKMYAAWGVDHLKYDSCCSHMFASQAETKQVLLDMSLALLNSSRPIAYHACHCGWLNIWEWGASIGANHWRIGQDISDDFNYGGLREGYYNDVLTMIDRGDSLQKYSGPGHWNDYDMLIVALNGGSDQLVGTGASNIEYRTHFSLWAMVASPLLIGADVRRMDNYSLETLTNKEIIAINQDTLGQQGKLEASAYNGTLQSYAKNMSDGSLAVALLNRGTTTATMAMLPPSYKKWKNWRVRDLWTHKEMGVWNNTYWVEVMSHEAKVLRLWPA